MFQEGSTHQPVPRTKVEVQATRGIDTIRDMLWIRVTFNKLLGDIRRSLGVVLLSAFSPLPVLFAFRVFTINTIMQTEIGAADQPVRVESFFRANNETHTRGILNPVDRGKSLHFYRAPVRSLAYAYEQDNNSGKTVRAITKGWTYMPCHERKMSAS